MTSEIILEKIQRLKQHKPRVLDLFSGCGGLSLGFDAAGFKIEAAIEIDENAARSHGQNFHGGADVHSRAKDITQLSPEQLAQDLGIGDPSSAFDVIIGGPPCQAFARVGRSKLREVAVHPEAFIHDPRARLYVEYLHYVDVCQPLAVLMENVPDILNHGGRNIAQEACEVLEMKGYVCGYTLLNSAFFGVPQMRERMFLIGYRKELVQEVSFPSPTHWVDLPPGYRGSRQVALKLLSRSEDKGNYIQPGEATPALPAAITAEQAIGDLPKITLHQHGLLKRGARRFTELIPYDPRPVSPYALTMKTWRGFQSGDGILDHVIRYLPRDFPLFQRLNPGDQYPEAHQHALDMLWEAAQANGIPEGSLEYEALKKSIVPPYDPGKFPNKWRKMWRDQPARTLLAHLGKDGYSHIHYESSQGRTISVREAARLQSFPDGFAFSGTMNPAFRQIGNAVPPLMAKAIAEKVIAVLKSSTGGRPLEYPRPAECVC